MTEKHSPLPEIFAFYRDGQLHHLHTDRKVFEEWMERSAWLYPSARCEIVSYTRAVNGLPEAIAALERAVHLANRLSKSDALAADGTRLSDIAKDYLSEFDAALAKAKGGSQPVAKEPGYRTCPADGGQCLCDGSRCASLTCIN